MNQEIKFTCSDCEQKMLVDASAAGLAVQCPGCGKELTVPAASVAAEVPQENPLRPRSQTVPENRFGADPLGGIPPSAAIPPSGNRQDFIAASVQNSRLESEVTELRQQIKKLRGDLNRVTGERDEAITQTHDLSAELESTQTNLQAYAQHADGLQQQLREAEADVAEARQQLTTTQSERTLALRDVQSLEQRVETLETDLTALRAEVAELIGKSGQLEQDLEKTRTQLTSAEHATETVRSELADVIKERDSLRRSVSESAAGVELVSVRELLSASEKECKRLGLNARQLTSDLERAEKARSERDEQIRTLRTELDLARRSAEAASEVKMRNDNEVLRGIIARQNNELEQRHVQLVRLKRARLGVQLIYLAFAIALAGIAIWALKVVPGLNLGKFLDP